MHAASALADKLALVTGAGGFIGSHLVEALLARGVRVRALTRYNGAGSRGHLDHLPPDPSRRIEHLAGDVRDSFFVDRAVEGVDVVFHLAALIAIPYSYEAPQSYVDTNVVGTLHVLEAARRHRTARVVHVSTSEVYGTARYTPMDEGHPLQAQSPYAATKIGADQLAASYQRAFDVPVATVRPFNTFGPRQSARAVIPTIVAQALHRDRVELGALDPVRDLNYVTDTAEGMIRAAEVDAAVGETVNLGRGEGVSIGALAARILALIGVERPVLARGERLRPAKSEVFTLVADNTRARQLLGWAPRVSLDDGLRAVIAWMREHPEAIRPGDYAR